MITSKLTEDTQMASGTKDVPTEVRTVVIQDLDELQLWRDQFGGLGWFSGVMFPWVPFDIVLMHLRYRLKPEMTWFCVMILDGEHLIAALPLVLTKVRVFKLFSFSVGLAPWEFAVRRGYGDADPDIHRELLSRATRAAFEHRRDMWSFDFRRLPESSSTTSFVAFGISGFVTITRHSENGRFFDVSASNDDFWSTMSSNLRKNLRKWTRRLEREHTTCTHHWLGRGPGNKAFNEFLTLEASGWKGKNSTAIASTEGSAAFFRKVVDYLSELGMMRWWFLEADNKMIAGAMGYQFESTLVVVKIAYDEDAASFGPGNLLFAKILQSALADKATREVDVLTDMDWHRRWNAKSRRFFRVWIYPCRLAPLLLLWLPRQLYKLLRRVPLFKAVADRINPRLEW